MCPCGVYYTELAASSHRPYTHLDGVGNYVAQIGVKDEASSIGPVPLVAMFDTIYE